MVFEAYAQLEGADHLMQPKRSRALNENTSRSAEQYLFERLGALAGTPTADIPYTPTFFPMLLQKSDGPADLVKNAIKLRDSGEVKDYRAWGWIVEQLPEKRHRNLLSRAIIADREYVKLDQSWKRPGVV